MQEITQVEEFLSSLSLKFKKHELFTCKYQMPSQRWHTMESSTKLSSQEKNKCQSSSACINAPFLSRTFNKTIAGYQHNVKSFSTFSSPPHITFTSRIMQPYNSLIVTQSSLILTVPGITHINNALCSAHCFISPSNFTLDVICSYGTYHHPTRPQGSNLTN